MLDDKELEKIDTQEMLIAALRLIASYYNQKIEGKHSLDIPTIKEKEFQMHPYCFCEEEDCELCNTPEFFYSPYGLDITWYKHIGRSFEFTSEVELDAEKICFMVKHIITIIKMKHKLKQLGKEKENDSD